MSFLTCRLVGRSRNRAAPASEWKCIGLDHSDDSLQGGHRFSGRSPLPRHSADEYHSTAFNLISATARSSWFESTVIGSKLDHTDSRQSGLTSRAGTVDQVPAGVLLGIDLAGRHAVHRHDHFESPLGGARRCIQYRSVS